MSLSSATSSVLSGEVLYPVTWTLSCARFSAAGGFTARSSAESLKPSRTISGADSIHVDEDAPAVDEDASASLVAAVGACVAAFAAFAAFAEVAEVAEVA